MNAVTSACFCRQEPQFTKVATDAEHDPTCGPSYATAASLITLSHVAAALPHLEHLTLVNSSIPNSSIGQFCAALLNFAETLTSLHIDCWEAEDKSVRPYQAYSCTLRQHVLDTIAEMKQLRQLSIRDWTNLVCTDCSGGRVLHGIPGLQEIRVEGYPCTHCVEQQCCHFDKALPFCAHAPESEPEASTAS